MLHCIDQGTGSPVLLVHGFPLNHQMWRHQIAPLAEQHRVIVPDLPGFGQSPITNREAETGITMAQYADALVALLDQLSVTEPVTYVGFSMGGYIGWQFLRHHRTRLRALVQCDTKAASDNDEARAKRYKMADGVVEWGSAHVAKLMTPNLFAPATLADELPLVGEVQQMIADTNPLAIAAAQRGMAVREDFTPKLASIDVPTLYIVGEHDAISPPEEMHAMAKATPGNQLIEIPAAGHMSPVENATAVNEAISGFLSA